MTMGRFGRIGESSDMDSVPEKGSPYFGRNMHSNLAHGMFDPISRRLV
jgi:hypothetical protein